MIWWFLVLIAILFGLGIIKHFIHNDSCCICGDKALRYDLISDEPYCCYHSPCDKEK